MANTILTPTAVTRKAALILHQKLNFIGSVNRQYDDSFAQSSAKIGTDLKIRLPNQYTVSSGASLSTQDTSETSTTLQVTSQKHVDVTFTSAELTLSLQDFADRILEPAMAVLAANIEADAFAMAKDVYQAVNNIGSAVNFRQVLLARKMLTDALAPQSNRRLILNTQDNVDLVDSLKGLLNPVDQLSKSYREGMMGSTASFGDVYENTLLPSQATGTDASNCTVNGASQTGASLTITNGSSKTFKQGDIVTLAGCNRVHPETKADTGVLQQFVVTADASSTTLALSPSITTSGARQNVSASPTNGGAITKVGSASGTYKPSLAFHRDAFVFATADLEDVSKYGAWGAREVYDGISIRVARQYAISTDTVPCRIDVLYGYKTIRPELACRILSN